jgi:hypothetical protein
VRSVFHAPERAWPYIRGGPALESLP